MEKEDIESILSGKLNNQRGVGTFFDHLVNDALIKNKYNKPVWFEPKFRKLFEYLIEAKSKRFAPYEDRESQLCTFSNKRKTIDDLTFLMSQGTHSPIKWKNLGIYKTAFDMVIYMQLISEIKPDVIIEYGSGSGGSAIWFADIALSLDINTKILSYDIKKPTIKDQNVCFEEIDLMKNFPDFKNLKGKKLVIEDAHVNVENVLLNTDKYLSKGDYLIIEDSGSKNKDILKFLSKANNSYMVDNYYVDFFGRNACCAIDSIFCVF